MTGAHVLVERATSGHRSMTPGEIRAFSKCRNERLRLPAFLAHYRRLGVDRFIIIDNDSSDGTTEYLVGQPDVHLFRTANRFREARGGADWLNALLGEFGIGSWCVTVDIDELLVYPGSEQASLRTLTEYLDHRGYEALACMLLDLYPAGPLTEGRYTAGDDLLAAAPYFDAGPYHQSPVDPCPGMLIRGGMRERVFYPELRTRGRGARIYDGMLDRVAFHAPILRDMPWLRARRRRNPPCLTKVPLIRWDEKSRYLTVHWISRQIVAPETGVLLHFKFLHDFHDRAVQEAARGEYYDGASEYRRYAEKLSKNPHMTLMYEGSTRFEGTTQMVRLGLMQETEAWANATAKKKRE
jgi:glycosyltransferase involved in cell wall biosynthesis